MQLNFVCDEQKNVTLPQSGCEMDSLQFPVFLPPHIRAIEGIQPKYKNV